MSSVGTYQLQPDSHSLLAHGPVGQLRFLNDLSELPSEIEVDALIASGDCFVTLATALDNLSESLTADAPTTRPQLEKLTSLLLYLQRHYSISHKRPDHRQ